MKNFNQVAEVVSGRRQSRELLFPDYTVQNNTFLLSFILRVDTRSYERNIYSTKRFQKYSKNQTYARVPRKINYPSENLITNIIGSVLYHPGLRIIGKLITCIVIRLWVARSLQNTIHDPYYYTA